ncbi:MAG: response regulator [Stenomitos rutilans HA7619-LM2]|jgi:CheY-like chemotaxis protein|nr:response regulator [Stenomitos rutilans HA7619-LM2]
MTIDDLIKLLQVFVSLAQALSWQLLILFVLIYFGAPLRNFVNNLGEFSFRAGASGLEATAKRRIEAGVLLGSAAAIKSGDATSSSPQLPGAEEAREIAAVVSQTLKPKVAQQLASASVLWVDDNPSDNAHEIRSLEALGIVFTMSASVQDALEKIRLAPYDAIVSDMRQANISQAGYILLEELQRLGVDTPVIIYGSTNEPSLKTEARQHGAFGSTGDPQELFSLVTMAVQKKR